jgi:hypothetical protein
MENSLHQNPAPANHRNTWIFVAALFICFCFFVVCGIFLGSVALVAKRSSDGATATAVVNAATATGAKKAQIATLTAYRTPTPIPLKYSLVDPFDSNQNGWSVGKTNDQFWVGESNIKDGAYTWTVQEFKKTFLNFSDFIGNPILDDFDVSVDTKIVNGTDVTCSGVIFRKSPQGWDAGGYAISICKNRQFFAGYTEKGKWLVTSDWVNSTSITNDWNHIEINGRGSHLIYKINNFIVYKMNDTHRSEGNFSLFIEVHEGNKDSGVKFLLPETQNLGGMTILFDNFNLQGR